MHQSDKPLSQDDAPGPARPWRKRLDHWAPRGGIRFHRFRRPILFLALTTVCVAVLTALRSSNYIAGCAAGAAAVLLGLLAAWTGGKALRRALWVVAGLLAVFALADAEATLLMRPRIALDGHPGSLFVRDPLLGYRARPGVRVTVALDRFGKVIYRAAYRIGPDGFRLTRGAATPDAPTTVFLGDSYTFGEGLNDADTLPQQYSAARGYGERVTNAAFSGYGPHQVLRLLQSDRLDHVLGGGPRLFVFPVIDEHVRRLSGRSPLDWYGTPHYELAAGSLRYVGPFYPGLSGWIHRLMLKSMGVTALANAFLIEPKPQSTELLGAIVAEAQRTVRRRYDGRFLVLLWDEPIWIDARNPAWARERAALDERIAAELKGRGVPFVRVSQLIPDYRAHMSAYVIDGNGHPTAAANRRLAQALAHVVGQDTSFETRRASS